MPERNTRERSRPRIGQRAFPGFVTCLVLSLLGVGTALGQVAALRLPDAPDPGQQASVQQTASIGGTVKDPNGAAIAGARVTLEGKTSAAVTSQDGSFAFPDAGSGRYRIIVTAAGFAAGSVSGVLGGGERVDSLSITLRVLATAADVEVVATQREVAAAQVAAEEKQRVFGVFPNFYVVYAWDAPAMTTKQKYNMAWKTSIDPVSILLTGAVAGIEQARNSFSGYGQGAQGYGKRFGAAYADGAISTFLAAAVLPSVLHQDPRYFYKGTGTVKSRILYSVEQVVVCRGDNGKVQPNYSNILGNLATGAISNAYYPASNRNGPGLTIENGLIGTAGGAVGNLIEEFFLRKATPHVPNYASAHP